MIPNGKSAEDTAEPAEKPTPKFTFIPTLTSLGEGADGFTPLLLEQDGYYAYALEKTGENIPADVIREARTKGREVVNDGRYDVYAISLYHVDLDGNINRLEDYTQLPDEDNDMGWKYFKSISGINGLARIDGSTLVTLEQTYMSGSSAPDNDEDFDKDTDYNEFRTVWYLRTIDAGTGKELSVKEIINEDGAYFNGASMKYADGKVYCISEADIGQGVTSVNLDGTVDITALVVGYAQKLITLGDGSPAVSVNRGDSSYISKLDRENSSFTDLYRLPDDVQEVYDGFSEYAFFFKLSSAYFGFNSDSNKDERLITFSSSNINGNRIISDIRTLDDGSMYFIIGDYEGDRYLNRIAYLERAPYDETKERRTVYIYSKSDTFALEDVIARFNSGSTDIKAEITDDESEADIIDLTGFDYRRKALSGELENLIPYIEKDAEIYISDFFENVMNAAEINGNLYETVAGFAINTVIGPRDIVGSRPYWTYDEYYSALQRAGCDAFDVYITREDIFREIMSVDMDWFVDYENGVCNFDNDNFASLLKFAKSFPETFDYANYKWDDQRDNSDLRLYNGRQLLQRVNLYGFDDACRAGFEYARPTTFIGYPSNNGIGSTLSICTFGVDENFAMSAKSESKEDAWKFLRTFFTKDYQKTLYFFPSCKEAFNEKLDDYRLEYLLDDDGDIMYDKKTGEKRKRAIGTMYLSDYTEVAYFGMDDKQAEDFFVFVNSINKKYDLPEDLYGVVCTATKDFFEGRENAWTAAARTQEMVTGWFNVSINQN